MACDDTTKAAVSGACGGGGSSSVGAKMGCAASKPSVSDESVAMRRRGPRASMVAGGKAEAFKDPHASEAQRVLASSGSVTLPVSAAAASPASPGGFSLRYAYISQRGYYPDAPNKANQDAVCAVECLGGSRGARRGGINMTDRLPDCRWTGSWHCSPPLALLPSVAHCCGYHMHTACS